MLGNWSICAAGPFATLTLLDGHRCPPPYRGSAVDQCIFHHDAKVDIVADGASATTVPMPSPVANLICGAMEGVK